MGVPRSAAHVVLGDYLRTVREASGRVQRDMPYSSGHVSAVENGCSMPSVEMLRTYVDLGGDYKTIATFYAAARKATEKKKRQQRAAQRKLTNVASNEADDILTEFQKTIRKISAKIGGFSQTSYALIGQLEERLEKRQAELDDDDPLLTLLKNGSDDEWAGGF